MKNKRLIFVYLILLMFVFAIPVIASDSSPSVPSAWAGDEVKRAIDLGIVPVDLQKDFQKDVTREEFALTAINFLAMQFNYDGAGDFLSICYANKEGEEPKYKRQDFTDTPDMLLSEAQGLGIISGRSDGTFDPNGSVTRQEAAKILLNTYSFYGGATTEHKKTMEDLWRAFFDSNTIASWAQDSVFYMWEWGVLVVDKNGRFNPFGHMTKEQCIVTFLRLYENAPISRALDNVTPLIPYEAEIQYVIDFTKDMITELKYQQATEDCMILCGVHGGLPHGDAYTAIYLVFRSGGYHKIYIPLHSENFRLSEDKRTLYFIDKVKDIDYAIDLQTAKVTEMK